VALCIALRSLSPSVCMRSNISLSFDLKDPTGIKQVSNY
jgi:hypothetical protein